MLHRFVGFLLLVSTLACTSEEVPQVNALSSGDRILAFGDSLTFGAGADPEQSYPAQLEALTGLQVIRSGVPGEVSKKGLQRLPKVLDRHRPALLILCHGGNDILRRLPAQQLYENLKEMVRLAQQRGIAVVLIGVPNFSLGLSSPEAAAVYSKLAEELQIPLEKHRLAELLHQQEYKSDAIHLNAQGYRLLAEAVEDLLRKAKAL